jgi:hypothetical protein
MITTKGTTMNYIPCEYMIYIYEDAQGNDLCESLDLPMYLGYRCPTAALEGSEMCLEHDPWASHWTDLDIA